MPRISRTTTHAHIVDHNRTTHMAPVREPHFTSDFSARTTTGYISTVLAFIHFVVSSRSDLQSDMGTYLANPFLRHGGDLFRKLRVLTRRGGG